LVGPARDRGKCLAILAFGDWSKKSLPKGTEARDVGRSAAHAVRQLVYGHNTAVICPIYSPESSNKNGYRKTPSKKIGFTPICNSDSYFLYY